MILRERTQDLLVLKEVYIEDEYGLDQRTFTGDDTVIDIGAHIGCFALKALLRGAGQVLCYEPDFMNFQYLQDNLVGKPQAMPFHMAVWRSDKLEETVPFFRVDGYTAMGHIGTPIDPANPDKCVSLVRAISLDSLLKPLGKVRLLKIDAEGSEWLILYTCTLLDQVEEIVVEVHENFMVDGCPYSCNRYGMAEFLKSKGFGEYGWKDHKGAKNLALFTARRTA